MTILQDMTRAVERLVVAPHHVTYSIPAERMATLLSHAALARQSLDRIGNGGLTDALARLMWEADERAYGHRSLMGPQPRKEWGADEQERFRLYAKAVLLSGLI